jgi:predicted ATPase with chaperone activity
MAIFSLQQNVLCRIEVRFQPGIPRIEVLGSSTKSIKDAALKAKILLVQMGYKFPRNKKIYVCIDPFVHSHVGIEAAIFMAMKASLEENIQDFFVYGDLSFSGECTSDKYEDDLLPYVPVHLKYLIGKKNLYINKEINWKANTQEKKIIWHESNSFLWIAALRAKEPFLIITKKDTDSRSILEDLKHLYFQFHNEELVTLEDIHQAKRTLPNSLEMFVATANLCPCDNFDAWKRKSCKFSQKRCFSYLGMILKFKIIKLITAVQEEGEPRVWSLPLKTYEVDIKLTKKEKVWERLLRFVPNNEQYRVLEKLRESARYHQNLLA